MHYNHRNNRWIRVLAAFLTTAMLITDNTVVALATEVPEDAVPVVTDVVDGVESPAGDETTGEPTVAGGENATSDAATGVIPVDETAEGENPEDIDTVNTEEDDGSVADPVIVEKETTLFGTAVIEEAHGEIGRILRNEFDAFANQSRTDYYWKYYNQLDAKNYTYGKTIYAYLVEHAQDFMNYDKAAHDSPDNLPEISPLVLRNDFRTMAAANAEYSKAYSQLYYAYAAFDYDHPEIFWLNTNAFQFDFIGTRVDDGDGNPNNDPYALCVEFNCAEGNHYTIYGNNPDAYDSDQAAVNTNVNTVKTLANAATGICNKVTAINDWLTYHNYYNRYVARSQRDQANQKTWKSASALTAQTWLTSATDFGDRSAPACEGYARAFKLICDQIGLPCIVVSGDGHMWNYVQNEDGVWYAVDVTWDDPVRDDEYTNRNSPAEVIHNYILVGSETVVPGETETFREDGHHPNGAFWTGGTVMPTPTISEEAYERNLAADISNLTVVPGNAALTVSYDTNSTGKYYYLFKEAGHDRPSAYQIQAMQTDIENGAGYGMVTAADAAAGHVTFDVANPYIANTDGYDFYLIQLTEDEYISEILSVTDIDPLAYVGWLEKNHKRYYFCPENDPNWEDNLNEHGEHENTRGAMAVGAVWINDLLFKFREDGSLEKVWHRIGNITIDDIPADAPSATAENTLQRGLTYQLHVNYFPEEAGLDYEEINDSRFVHWSSSNPNIVSVDSDGTIHALQSTVAPVIITAVTGDDDRRSAKPTATIEIEVSNPVGWFSVEGYKFYGLRTSTGVTLATGFKDIEGHRYYFYPADDTEHVPCSMATGVELIGGVYYDFGEYGILTDETGVSEGFVTLNGKTYYLDGETHVLVTDENIRIGDRYYGFDGDGVLYQAAFFKRVIGGDTWYFYADEGGALATGMRYVNREGNRYFSDVAYAAANGVPVGSLQEGILELQGKHYFFDEITESLGLHGELIVNGGLMQYGYFEADGKHYYALPYGNANAGILQSGFVKIDNAWKLFLGAEDADPFSETEDEYLNGWLAVSAPGAYRRYYINVKGQRLTGWQKINGKQYYFNADGTAASGLTHIGNDDYFFGINNHFGLPNDDYGIMKTGKVTYPPHTNFFATNGKRVTGWQFDGSWDYYDPATGEICAVVPGAPNTSLSDDYWASMNVSGENYYYYFKNNSTRATGWQTIEGQKYYFDTTAGIANGRMFTGFQKIGTSYYYFKENAADRGMLLTGLCTYIVGGVDYTYYANNSGVLQLGWQKVDGRWHYFDRTVGYEVDAAIDEDYWSTAEDAFGTVYTYYFRNGVTMVTGIQLIDGQYYYFSTNAQDGSLGRLLKNDFVTVGNNTYYADGEGILQSGAFTIAAPSPYAGNYYANANRILQTGWQMVDGNRRYFTTAADVTADPAMIIGRERATASPDGFWYQLTDTDDWYYFSNKSSMLKGWLTIDTDRYYFDNNGLMAKGTFKVGLNNYRTHAGEAGYDEQRAGVIYMNEWFAYHHPDDAAGALRYQYYNANGLKLTGWQNLPIDGNVQPCYLSPTDTEHYSIGDRYTGINQIGNTKYLFDAHGVNIRSQVATLEADVANRISAEMAGTYYTNKNGILLTGWQQINNKWRFFDTVSGKELAVVMDEDGFIRTGTDVYFSNGTKLATGFVTVKGKRYYFYDNVDNPATYTKMAKGWFLVGNNKYYADPADGHLYSGIAVISGETFDFNAQNILLTGWQLTGSAVNDWHFFDNTIDKNNEHFGAQLATAYCGNGYYELTLGGSTYFYRFVNNKLQTGWQTIDGGKYYFAENGQLQTGFFKIGRVWYYTANAGGVDELGRVSQGFHTVTVDGVSRTCYCNANGQCQTGWQMIGGKSYYFNPAEGDNYGAMLYGRLNISGKYYYTNTDGFKVTNAFIDYCGETYYANASGQLLTGLQTLKVGGVNYRFCFDSECRMYSGWQMIGKDQYCFSDGTDGLPKGAALSGKRTIDGATYYFNSNGLAQTGWQKISNAWYYFAGTEDVLKGNITENNLGKCYYDESLLPIPMDNWREVTFAPGRTRQFFISDNRTVAKGWMNVKDALGVTRRYYFDPVTGELWTGYHKVGNASYWMLDKGENMVAGRRQIEIEGVTSWYFLNANGQFLTGWQTDRSTGKVYYYGANGIEDHGFPYPDALTPTLRVLNIAGKPYRLNLDGSRFGAGLADGYYTDKNGMFLTGWQTIRVGNVNYKFYFDIGTYEMYLDELITLSGQKYYLDPDGYMIANAYRDISGSRYFFNRNGQAVSGWYNNCYFDPVTKAMQTGVIMIGGSKYLLGDDGVRRTGLQTTGGEQYYFNPKTGAAQTGWMKMGTVWYYFASAADEALGRVGAGELGKCCYEELIPPADEWRTIDFENGDTCKYYINSRGAILKGWQNIKQGTVTRRYYFNGNGELLCGDFVINNVRYYADPVTGIAYTGFRNEGDGWHYYANAQMMTGWQKVKGGDGVERKYYLNANGILYTGLRSLNGSYYYFHEGEPGKLTPGEDDNRFGMLLTGEFEDAGGNVRYANTNGVLLGGWQNYRGPGESTASWKYLNPMTLIKEDAEQIYPNQYWYRVGTDLFYFSNNRTLAKGFVNVTDPSRHTEQYFFDGTGRLLIGDDDRIIVATGAVYRTKADDGVHPESAGRIDKTEGFTEIGTNKYYFTSAGKMLTGWQNIKHGRITKQYYFDVDGALWFGDFSVNGLHYYAYPADAPEYPGSMYGGFRAEAGSYRYYSNGQRLTGWQTLTATIHGTDRTKRKYYFDPATGLMETGFATIAGVPYYFSENDADLGTMRTGYITAGTDHYYLNANGLLQKGWVNVGGTFRYFAQADGKEIAPTVAVNPASKQYWTAIEEGGDFKVYYINNNRSLFTGWQTIAGKRYYFNTNGMLVTDGEDPGNVQLQVSGGPVTMKLLSLGSAVYIVSPLDAVAFAAGDRSSGMVRAGLCTVTGSDILEHDGTYCFNANGQMLTGWQTASDALGNTGRYYFNNIGLYTTGASYIGNTQYLFDLQGKLLTNNQTTNLYNVSGNYYYPDKNGVLLKGWQKVNDVWYFFDTQTGALSYQEPGGTIAGIDEYTVRGNWVTLGALPGQKYYLSGNKVLTGWQDILGAGDVTYRYYFDPTGQLMTGTFKIGNNTYRTHIVETGDLTTSETDAYGSVYANAFYHYPLDPDHYEYFNASGVMLTGWQNIDIPGSEGRYYFDIDGRMLTGIITVGASRYLFNSDPMSATYHYGALVTNDYFAMSGNYYKTNANGMLLTGWQRFATAGTMNWHYFDPVTGIEDVTAITPTVDAGQWLREGNATYYMAKGVLYKGWKTIGANQYYFDPVTGEMAAGIVKISGKAYCFGLNGVLQVGKASVDGTSYYTDRNGALYYGWITAGNTKYYADPANGMLSTGFTTIGTKLYYFSEETSKVGEMATGFFSVPNNGQSYYDESANASNLYYALSNGLVHQPGWDVISLNPKSQYAQKWSYYFSPNQVGTTKDGTVIRGEVAIGDVEIADDGTVTFLGAVDHLGNYIGLHPDVDAEHFYRFDPDTGARRKAVLVFYGNYYGEADYEYDHEHEVVTKVTARMSKSQVDSMHSISKYVNTDRQFADESVDFYYVNSNVRAEQQRLYDAGLTSYNPTVTTFPMAASSHYPYSDDNPESRMYVVGNDLTDATGGGADGNVDVYDVEKYSWDVYRRAYDKFGANNLAMIGSSSGGGVCLALCQKAISDPDYDQPANTLLFSPWVDLAMDNPRIASITPAQSEFLDIGTAKYWAARYTRDNDISPYYQLDGHASPEGVTNKFASPERGDHVVELRNIVIYTGTYDLFSPDCVDLANTANNGGGNVVLKNYSRMIHGYMFNKSSLAPSVETIHDASWRIMTQ